jgi:hypothetical protein
MLAAVRDSLGPGIATVEARDSIWLRIALDRPLDTLFVPGPANIVVKHADSTQAEVAEVITQAEYDGRVADSARARAVEDSVRRAEAADSIRAADSTRAAASGAAVAAPPRPTGRRPGAPTRPPLTPVRDSITQERPRPEAQLPVTAIHVRLARALNPDTAYRVRTEDLVSVTGAVRSSERVFTSPRRAVQPDTAAPPDTGRGKRD